MSSRGRKPLPPTREVPEIPEGHELSFDEDRFEEEPSTLESWPTPAPELAAEVGRQRPHLVLLFGRNVGQVFKLDRDVVRVGRDRQCEVQLADSGISRQHMSIVRDPSGSFALRDLGSRNGTYLNEQRIDGPQPLHHNDVIHVGSNTVLKFIEKGSLEVDYALSMYDAAMTDVLTGAYNRRYLEQQLVKEIAFARRHELALSLILMDLDHFKTVNDNYGHPAGDQVLQEFAKLIGRSIRTEDTLARHGGEEFAILCRQTGRVGAMAKAERIRKLTAEHTFCRESLGLRLTVSIGVAAMDETEGVDPELLVAYADQALYRAKSAGRNRVVCFQSS